MQRFKKLTSEQKKLRLLALPLVAGVRLSLSIIGFRYTLRFVNRMASGVGRREGTSSEELCAAIVSSSRFVPEATCLTQALAGHLLCARHGRPTTIRIGVSRQAAGSPLRAHAWLDSANGVLLGSNDQLAQFFPLPHDFHNASTNGLSLQ